MFNPAAPYPYLLSTMYLSVPDIENPNLFACGCLDIAHLYVEQCQPSSGSAKAVCPKNGRYQHNLLHSL